MKKRRKKGAKTKNKVGLGGDFPAMQMTSSGLNKTTKGTSGHQNICLAAGGLPESIGLVCQRRRGTAPRIAPPNAVLSRRGLVAKHAHIERGQIRTFKADTLGVQPMGTGFTGRQSVW